jgi:xylulokinase
VAGTVLAIDFGQTWCRALWVDRDGRAVAEGRGSTLGLPGFGFGPAEGEELWRALVAAVRDTGEAEPPAAIALSSRIGLGVWLDGDSDPVDLGRPVPLEAGDAEMDAVYGAPGWSADTLPTYAPMLVARTRWLREEHAEAFARTRRAGALHDWLLLKMTGRWATNPATGPGLPAGAWPPAVAALTGLPLAAFPEVRGFAESVGGLSAAAASALGVREGTPVAAGYHDGAAATAGTGCLEPGDACVTLGTSVALRVVADRPPGDWFRYPIWPGRWAWMRGLELALAQLQTVADRLGGGHGALTRLAEAAPPGANGLRLPPLPPNESGRRAEGIDRALADGFTPGQVYRAGLEGIALGVLGLVRQAGAAALEPRRFVLTGGGARNRLLLDILAAVLATPLEIAEPEGGARGAALAAAVRAGWHGSIAESAASLVGAGERVAPRPALVDAYRPLASGISRPTDPWEPRPYWRALAT